MELFIVIYSHVKFIIFKKNQIRQDEIKRSIYDLMAIMHIILYRSKLKKKLTNLLKINYSRKKCSMSVLCLH